MKLTQKLVDVSRLTDEEMEVLFAGLRYQKVGGGAAIVEFAERD